MEHKRAWIYCRTAHPDTHALAMQRAHLKAFAEKQGFEIIGITAEHVSGLAEVFHAADAGNIDLLLVMNLSRLSRDTEKAESYLRWLKDRHVDVVCADGTAPQTSREMLHQLMKANRALLSAAK